MTIPAQAQPDTASPTPLPSGNSGGTGVTSRVAEERRQLSLEMAVRLECAAAGDNNYNSNRVVTVAKHLESYLKGSAK